ncbi:MAG: hypothetical protein ACJ8KF_13565 [Chthoniobacterales bacterium]
MRQLMVAPRAKSVSISKAAVSVKDWEIIPDNLSEGGWSWSCVTTLDRKGRPIFIGDAHRGDGKRFIVHADEILTACVELQSVI